VFPPRLHHNFSIINIRMTVTEIWVVIVMRYGSWIYNYLCNQYLSPLKLWVRIPLTLCDKVCQRLMTGWCCFPGPPVSSTNKTDHHDITEILLKVGGMIIHHKQTNKQTEILAGLCKSAHTWTKIIYAWLKT
jgi:hypothetical protein